MIKQHKLIQKQHKLIQLFSAFFVDKCVQVPWLTHCSRHQWQPFFTPSNQALELLTVPKWRCHNFPYRGNLAESDQHQQGGTLLLLTRQFGLRLKTVSPSAQVSSMVSFFRETAESANHRQRLSQKVVSCFHVSIFIDLLSMYLVVARHWHMPHDNLYIHIYTVFQKKNIHSYYWLQVEE